MLYVNLERKWKLSISGSINNFLTDISENNTFIALFKYWFSDKFEEEEGKIQYVKRMTDERFDVDEELLDDIKRVFEERFYKKISGEINGFDDKEYSKHDMILIIGDLVDRLDNMEQENCGVCEVIELSDFRK